MKQFLRHSIFLLVGLAFGGLGGMAVTAQLMKANRRERAEFHAREVAALKQADREPAAIQPPPANGSASAHGLDLASLLTRMMSQYDQPYGSLGSWNLRFEGATMMVASLLLFAFVVFTTIERREFKAIEPAPASATS